MGGFEVLIFKYFEAHPELLLVFIAGGAWARWEISKRSAKATNEEVLTEVVRSIRTCSRSMEKVGDAVQKNHECLLVIGSTIDRMDRRINGK